MFSNPEKNLKAFGLQEDDIVVDLGAGTGYYTLAAGLLVPRGKIYAVELEKDFLAVVQSKAKDAGLKNIEAIWGNIEQKGGTKIGDGIADRVIASNILFQIEDKNGCIEEIRRILKPKGKVLLVDWAESSIRNSHTVVSKDAARVMFEKKGFILEKEIDAGDYHYGMILRKP